MQYKNTNRERNVKEQHTQFNAPRLSLPLDMDNNNNNNNNNNDNNDNDKTQDPADHQMQQI